MSDISAKLKQGQHLSFEESKSLFSDLMEDYLDEVFENIVSDNLTMRMENEKNKDNWTEDDDKQKTCMHAFETFINVLIGKKATSDTLDSSMHSST